MIAFIAPELKPFFFPRSYAQDQLMRSRSHSPAREISSLRGAAYLLEAHLQHARYDVGINTLDDLVDEESVGVYNVDYVPDVDIKPPDSGASAGIGSPLLPIPRRK
jgi:hypothetical protein